jgi:subtilisin family serine protease
VYSLTQSRRSRRFRTGRLVAIGVVAFGLFAAATTAAIAGSGSSHASGPGGRPIGRVSLKRQADFTGPATAKRAKAGRTIGKAGRVPAATQNGKFRAAGKDAVADSYIVVLKGGNATTTQVTGTADRLTRAHHGSVGRVYSQTLRGFSATLTEADAQQLAADPGVAYVEQNRYVRASDTKYFPITNYDHSYLWGLDRIDQAFLPLSGNYGAPDYVDNTVHVYVLDTGVESQQSEFHGYHVGILPGWSATFTGDQVAACGANTNGQDDNGHGTFVTAEIAGTTFGVTSSAVIEPVKVLDCTGEGTVAEIVEGIEHVTATAVKPAVANMSLGGTASPAIDDAVNASIASGITYVVAAGNDNTDACTQSPARVPGAITVGATDITDFRASFSNYGPCVDLFAPGVNIESSYLYDANGNKSLSGYAYASGTSMASPFVAGDAVDLLHVHQDWTPAQVAAAIDAADLVNTVHAAGPGSPTKLLRKGEPGVPLRIGLKAHANNRIVTAEAGGTKPLIANRYNVGDWEGFWVDDAGDGAHVGLKAIADNKYVTAEAGGAAPLIARGGALGAWEKFTIVHNADGSISLQANANGKYVTADPGGGQPLIANRTSIGPWEEFDLTGPAATVVVVALANNKVVTAESGGAKPLIANRQSWGAWETFDVVDAGGYATLLAHANGRFVTAEAAGAAPLIARSPGYGDWEQYTLLNNDDGTLSFLAHANNRVVSADAAGGQPLIANRANVGGAWEEFVAMVTSELQ